LRILHISEAFGGGVFTSMTRLASGLAQRGHEVHLAFARRPETPADVAAFVHAGVTLHEVDLARSIKPRSDLAGTIALVRLIRSVRPDLVHLHSSKAGVLGRIAAAVTGTASRTLYSPRGLAFLQENYSPRARRFFEMVEWGAARLGGTVVACSRSEEVLVRERIRSRSVALVENAVDVEAVPVHVPSDDGIMRVGAIGRVAYQNNPELVAAIARQLARPDVQFQWIGGGEPEGARALEAAGVKVTGWLRRPEALAALARMDICLHATRWEGMPVALIEAQVAGVPAVTTDVVGNRDVVRHEETGFIASTPEGIADAVSRLIADAPLRARLGRRAREVALVRFSLERLLDDYERLYAATLERATGTRAM
jgi:glycosyltransferase involved in cell wall biosynthesis